MGYDETSPIDSEDLMLATADFQDSRSHTGSVSSNYEGHSSSFSPQTSPPYTYSGEYTSAHYGQSSARSGHLSPLDVTTSPGGLPPFKSPSVSENTHASSQSYHTHPVSSSHTQSPTSYYSSQNSYAPQSSWDPIRTSLRDQGRSSLPTLPAIDTSLSRYRPNPIGSTPSSKGDIYSSQQAPHRPYSSATSSTSSSSPGGSTAHYPSSNFPMLTSSFTPADSSSQRYPSSMASNIQTSHASNTSEYFQSSSPYLQRTSSTARHSVYEPGGYTSPPVSNPYASSAQWHASLQSQDARSTGPQRLTGPIPPPLSTYSSHPSTAASPDETSPNISPQHNTSHVAYWDRNKFEGR